MVKDKFFTLFLFKNSPSGFEWFFIPSITWSVRFNPLPFFSKWVTSLTDCLLWWNPSGSILLRTLSPICPNGVWPKSCPSAVASTKSSLKFNALAIDLTICETSITCVNLVVKWSPIGATKTWLLCFSLLKEFVWIILSLSLWNYVLVGDNDSFTLRLELIDKVAYLEKSFSFASKFFLIMSKFWYSIYSIKLWIFM